MRYRARVRIRGAKSRSRTFKRKTDALTWAAKIEHDLGHGVYVPTGADRRRTLADLIDKFEKEQLPIRARNADRKKMSAQLKWWKENAGFITLDKLTPGEISGYRSQLLTRKTGRAAPTAAPDERDVSITPATANRYLAALSAVCKWAWKELHWLPNNPVLAVSKGAEHTGIVRYLDDDEREGLIAACKASADPNIYCAVMLALATGARAGNLRRSDLGRRRPQGLAAAIRRDEESGSHGTFLSSGPRKPCCKRSSTRIRPKRAGCSRVPRRLRRQTLIGLGATFAAPPG